MCYNEIKNKRFKAGRFDMKKRIGIAGLTILILLGLLMLSAVQTFWGITYTFEYFYYDNHSWGEITYISDRIRAISDISSYPDHINIQVKLDQPVDNNDYYSITFDTVREMKKRKKHIEYKGARALIVFNDFYNSDGDVITKTDIIMSVVSSIIFIAELIIIFVIIRHLYKKYNL